MGSQCKLSLSRLHHSYQVDVYPVKEFSYIKFRARSLQQLLHSTKLTTFVKGLIYKTIIRMITVGEILILTVPKLSCTSSPWTRRVTQAHRAIVSSMALPKKPPKNFILKYCSQNNLVTSRTQEKQTFVADREQFLSKQIAP